jgi:hypothetical protein
MRHVGLLGVLGLVLVGVSFAQDGPAPRYGVEADLKSFPQSTPRETLATILQAIERKRINYILAHLTDPVFVDERLKSTKVTFEQLVDEVSKKFADEPDTIKELKRFWKEGKWTDSGETATATLDDVKGRQVYMQKRGTRWFLDNRQAAKTEEKK